MEKICSKCKKSFPIIMFPKNGYDKNGNQKTRSDCKNCRAKKLNSTHCRFLKYKRNAKRRGLKFSLTKKEFSSFEERNCYYCGDKLSRVSLDRIDNDLGYEKNNVVPCCHMCNSFKHVFEEKEFLDHINKIYYHQNRKVKNGE